jgi:hypothetical protein
MILAVTKVGFLRASSQEFLEDECNVGSSFRCSHRRELATPSIWRLGRSFRSSPALPCSLSLEAFRRAMGNDLERRKIGAGRGAAFQRGNGRCLLPDRRVVVDGGRIASQMYQDVMNNQRT